jgi:tetratricopeptide (TPR) repeat protein
MKDNPSFKNELEEKIKDNSQSIVFARLADLYLKEDRIDEAIQLCQNGIATHPFYVTGYYILAKAYLLKNDLENSESALKKVLSHDREYISAYKHLGDIMVKQGWDNSAVSHYKDILQIDLLEKTALSAISKISNEPVRAEDLLSAADNSAPEDRAEKRKQPAKEEEWISQIREVFPDELSDYAPPEEVPAETTEVSEIPQVKEKSTEDLPVSETGETFQITEPEEAQTIPPEDDSAQTVILDEADPFSLSAGDNLIEVLSDTPKPEPNPEPTETETDSGGQSETPASDVTVESVSIDWEGIQDAPVLEPYPEQAQDHPQDKNPEENTVAENKRIIDIDESDLIESIEFESFQKPGSPPDEKFVPVDEAEILEPILEKNGQSSSSPDDSMIIDMDHEPDKTAEPVPAVPGIKMNPDNTEKITASSPAAKQKKKEPGKSQKILTPTLGEIYIAQEQFDKAMQVFKKLSELHPEEKKYKDKIKFLEEKIKDNNL